MNASLRRRLLAALPLACALLASAASAAEAFPSRPIRLVVPFTPGGNIGAEAVARNAPDGYTLLIGTLGTQVTNQLFRWLSEGRASPQSRDRNDPGLPPWLPLPSQMLRLLPGSACSQHPRLAGTGNRYQCGQSSPFASFPMSSFFPVLTITNGYSMIV